MAIHGDTPSDKSKLYGPISQLLRDAPCHRSDRILSRGLSSPRRFNIFDREVFYDESPSSIGVKPPNTCEVSIGPVS